MKQRVFQHESGIRVLMTLPAQRMIGADNVAEFVRVLIEMMVAMDASQGFVCKSGAAVAIYVLRSDGWTGIMGLKREP